MGNEVFADDGSIIEHLSKSSVEKYVNCGEAYRRRYIVKEKTHTSANLVFGVAFHEAIEEAIRQREYHNTAFNLEEYWPMVYNKELGEHTSVLFEEDSPEEQIELGLRLFSNQELWDVLAEYKPAKIMTVSEEGEKEDLAIEMKVEFPVPGMPVPFIGYIDMLCDDYVPMDFKTAGRKWNNDKAQKEMQPSFYLAGLALMGYVVPGNKFRHLVVTKTRNPDVTIWETTRSKQEMEWHMKLAATAYKGIAAGIFIPNPTSWLCSPSYCEFYLSCMGGE